MQRATFISKLISFFQIAHLHNIISFVYKTQETAYLVAAHLMDFVQKHGFNVYFFMRIFTLIQLIDGWNITIQTKLIQCVNQMRKIAVLIAVRLMDNVLFIINLLDIGVVFTQA